MHTCIQQFVQTVFMVAYQFTSEHLPFIYAFFYFNYFNLSLATYVNTAWCVGINLHDFVSLLSDGMGPLSSLEYCTVWGIYNFS